MPTVTFSCNEALLNFAQRWFGLGQNKRWITAMFLQAVGIKILDRNVYTLGRVFKFEFKFNSYTHSNSNTSSDLKIETAQSSCWMSIYNRPILLRGGLSPRKPSYTLDTCRQQVLKELYKKHNA